MMRRGELWWADLPDPTGSGPGMRRPVLVIQSNPFNDSKLRTVIVAVVTSNLKLADAPGNVRVARGDSGLNKPSVINITQVLTVNRDRLKRRVRALPAAAMQRVDEGLRMVVGL